MEERMKNECCPMKNLKNYFYYSSNDQIKQKWITVYQDECVCACACVISNMSYLLHSVTVAFMEETKCIL